MKLDTQRERARKLFRERRKLVIPLGVIAFGALSGWLLFLTRPAVSVQRPEPARPLVRVVEVELADVQLTVRTHGTVEPRTESDLVPEVSGPVIWVSPALVSGGSFNTGEPLLRIDPIDYELAAEQARASLERARSDHQRASRDLKRQRGLKDRKMASAADYDDAVNQERVNAAALREAKALVAKAERDLERTEMRAPYAGLVREEKVDIGQFVTRGAAVGRIYAVDFAEVRLPIPDEQLAYLDLPVLRRAKPPADPNAEPGTEAGTNPRMDPVVRLRARFAGAEHTWVGSIVRTEGEIDRRSRMVTAVARIEDPYGLRSEGQQVPLAVGLFVEAEIQGHLAKGVSVLPRSAIRDGDQVWVVDAEERLRFRDVEVLRSSGNEVVIRQGLESGERVCISPLQTAVDGMFVRAAGQRDPAGPL